MKFMGNSLIKAKEFIPNQICDQDMLIDRLFFFPICFFTIIFACKTVTFLLITRVKFFSSGLPARKTSHLPAELTPKHRMA